MANEQEPIGTLDPLCTASTFELPSAPRDQIRLIVDRIPRRSIDLSILKKAPNRRWHKSPSAVVAGAVDGTVGIASPEREIIVGDVEIDVYKDARDAKNPDFAFNNGGTTVNTANLQLLFWGGFWETASGPSADDVTGAMSQLLASPYLSQMDQYGLQRLTLSSSTIVLDNVSSPFDDDNVYDMVWTLIDQGAFPEPDDPGGRIVYLVIAPKGTAFDDSSARGAHNDALDDDITEVFDRDHAWMGWTNYGTLDFITQVLSHELVEIISDPEPDSAWQMSRKINGGTEIGDACNNTGAQPEGLMVQAYWSQVHRACIVPRRRHIVMLTASDGRVTADQVTETRSADVTPGPGCQPGIYCYRRHVTDETVTLTADPQRFTAPVLIWSIEGQQVAVNSAGNVGFTAEVWTAQPGGSVASVRTVNVGYTSTATSLVLTNDPADGTYGFEVVATANEKDAPAVVASATQGVGFTGQYLQWDDHYLRDQAACIGETLRKGRQLVAQIGPRIDKGDPVPPWVDQLPRWLSDRARGELRQIGRLGHYVERGDARLASEIRKCGEALFNLPGGSLSPENRDTR